MRYRVAVVLLAVPWLIAAAPSTVRVSGQIRGGSGRHEIQIALWNEAGFLGQPVQKARVEPGARAGFQFDVLPGRWAVSAFEDVNGNGILDQGVLGPKEPAGFWRAFHGWRKPRFDDVATQVDRDIANADIDLH